MGLEHHRATGGQGRGGVAAGGGERQWEVAGAEHGHWAHGGAVLAQVRARQRFALGQGLVDTRTVEVATAQHLGEQAHLPAGAATLALDTGGGQRGFAAGQGYEVIAQGIEFVGDGVEEFGTARGRQVAVDRESALGGFHGQVDLAQGGLEKRARQLLAGGGVDAVQASIAFGAALTVNEVESGEVHLKSSLGEK